MATTLTPIEPIDYLVIGHITRDIIPGGFLTGGTASYAALTARAHGLRVGIVSAHPHPYPESLAGIPILGPDTDQPTTFENINTPGGRIQYLHHRAPEIHLHHIPETWRNARMVHIGPVAQEVDPHIISAFPHSQIGITPQGWMRSWDSARRVHFSEWLEAAYVLEKADAVVLSIEDVERKEEIIESMLASIRVMVVTEGAAGARLYWNGDMRTFRPPQVEEVDPVGAGDIFATSFFIRLQTTHNPWEAARYATQIAATSVTRRGMLGTPTRDEINQLIFEILPNG